MAKGSAASTETSKIIIMNQNLQLKKDLIAIAKNVDGSGLSNFLRRHLIKIRDSYPMEMRIAKE